MPLQKPMTDSRAFNYDAIADAYAAGVDSAPYNALYERPALLDLMPPVDGAQILDAGCGSGWYAVELSRRGAAVFGIDASPQMIGHAMGRLEREDIPDPSSIVFRVADLGQPLAFASNSSFDGVISSLVLHYLSDWRPTLLEFRRVLKPGGWLLFSTHHPAADAMRLNTTRYAEVEEVTDYWKWVGTLRYYRRPLSEIVNSLSETGFRIEHLVEPIPTEAFRLAKPDSFERMLSQPEFLLILARTDA